MKNITISAMLVIAFLQIGCNPKKTDITTAPNLIFKFAFDSTQIRLNGKGIETPVAAGNAGQNPSFNFISSHYIELAETALTPLGDKGFLFKSTEVTTGGASAIDFENSNVVKPGDVFFSIPLKNINPGTYEYLRVSLAYQNYSVKYFVDTVSFGGTQYAVNQTFPSTIASFIGFNSYVKSYALGDTNITLNANEAQGFWGSRTKGTLFAGTPYAYNFVNTQQGQVPAGATTVVNPFASQLAGLPANSCLVVAPFASSKLTITGKEVKDIVVTVKLSTNKSFEWKEVGTPNGLWEPLKGENVVDMGIRGMIPSFQ